MKTQTEVIYHCVRCGHVVHSEIQDMPPQCCGQAMTTAVTETLAKGVDSEPQESAETPPIIEERKKPR